MSNNILLKDKNNLIQFIKKTNKFTNGPKVIEFEKKWSKWLGVKYSTFVNSGASANLISINILKELNNNKKEIILPAFTWSSDVVSVINAGFKPIFVDINFENLALNENLVKKGVALIQSTNLSHKLYSIFIKKAFPNAKMFVNDQDEEIYFKLK